MLSKDEEKSGTQEHRSLNLKSIKIFLKFHRLTLLQANALPIFDNYELIMDIK